jgi:hypothetical protein
MLSKLPCTLKIPVLRRKVMAELKADFVGCLINAVSILDPSRLQQYFILRGQSSDRSPSSVRSIQLNPPVSINTPFSFNSTGLGWRPHFDYVAHTLPLCYH